MTMEPSPEYVRQELQLANEALDDAEFLLQDDRLKAAANRAYYAMFYAVRAALASAGVERPRSHRGAINLFIRHWVRTDKVDQVLAKDLQDAFDLRQKGDYDVYAVLGGEVVRETIEKAKTFVSTFKGILE
jgi:uncharacterized protein (UPF0332 family)